MSNIEIAVRVRPLIDREKRENLQPLWEIKENSIVQTSGLSGDPYIFDHIFNENQSNADLYHTVVKPLVLSCLEGINATILAYGQTSSGKTHTVVGTKDNPGVITHAVNEIFNFIDNDCSRDFLLRCSYLEIYNEKVNDLLNVNGMDLKVREDYNQQVYVEKAQEEVIHTPEDFFGLMKRGMKTRKMGCTDMNERSSRSHTILKLVIQSQCKESEGSFTESVLSLVDLAGSERVGQMSMDRSRQVEGVSINKSLTTLALVIRRLSENDTFVNYRDSKLTRLLQHSLGGNSKTLIIATVTVAASEETKSTLEFAQRAKTVKNRPEVNRRVTDKDQLKLYERLCENYKSEIEKLYSEKLEKERTINALNGKISNIRLFTDLGSNKSDSAPKIRRHTMWSHSHDQQNVSPLKPSQIQSQILAEPGTPPAKVRLEKQLLEISYGSLKEFTNLERQLTKDGLDYLNDYEELLARLREENCNYQLIQKTIMTELRDTKEHLLTLKRLLADPENNSPGFLCTIMEEDFAVFKQENCKVKLEENVDGLSNEEFKSKITALESLLKQKDLIIKSKDEEILQKNYQIDKLSEAISIKDQKLCFCFSEKTEVISIVNNKNEETSKDDERQINNLHNKIKTLEELLEQQELVATINEEVITKKSEEVNQLQEQIGKLNEDNLSKEQELAKLCVCFSEKIEEVSKKNDEIHELQNQISKLSDKNLINDQELAKLRENISSLNEELERLAFTNKIQEINRLKTTVQMLEDKLEKANKDIIIKDQELSKLQMINEGDDALGRKLEELKNENAIKEKKIIDLQLEFDDEKKRLAELQNLISNKVKEINLLNATVETLNQKLEDTNNLINTKDQELSKLQLKIKEGDVNKEEVANLRSDLTYRNEKLLELEKLISVKIEEINRLNTTVITLSDKLQDANEIIITKDQELSKLHLKNEEGDVLEKTLAEIKKENALKQEEVINLQLNLSIKDEKISDMQKLISEKIEEINRLNAAVINLTDNLQDANKVITTKDRELSELYLKNDEDGVLETKLSELKKENSSKEQEVNNLRLDLADNKKMLSEFEKLISDKMQEIDCLNEIILTKDQELSKLHLKNDEADVLEKTLAEMKKESVVKQQEVINLRLNISEKEEQISDMQKLISNKLEEVNRLNATVIALNDQLQKANEIIVTKDQKLSKLHLKNEEAEILEKTLAEIKKENAGKQQEVINLRLNLSDKEEKISDMQKLISDKMEEVNCLNTTVITLKNKLQDASQVIVAKDRELSNVLEIKLAEMKKENDIKKQEVIDLRLNLSHQKEKFTELQSLISNKIDEINRLNATVQTLNNKLNSANQIIITKDREVDDVIERKLAEFKKENTIKEQEVANLRLALSDKNEKLSDMQNSFSKKLEEIKNLKDKVSLLTNKLAKPHESRELEILQSNLSEKVREISTLQQSVTKLNEEIQKLRSDKDLLKETLAKIHSSDSDKEKEITELRRSVTKQNVEINNLQDKLSGLLTKKLSKSNDQMSNRELDNLRKCVSDKDKEIQRLNRKLSRTNPFKEKYDNNVTALDQSDTEENSAISPYDKIFDDFNQGGFILENSDLKRELKMTKALHGASETKCRQQSVVIDHLTETNLKMTETVEKLKQELREVKRKRSATPPQPDCLPLSPNQIRKMKRRSIHDQRRGLSPGGEDIRNTFTDLHKDSTKGHCGNQQPVQLVDKACQIQESGNTDNYRQEYEALCDKYTALQKVARYRRREANHLRLKLNIPPDAPVLPAHDAS